MVKPSEIIGDWIDPLTGIKLFRRGGEFTQAALRGMVDQAQTDSSARIPSGFMIRLPNGMMAWSAWRGTTLLRSDGKHLTKDGWE